METYPLGDITYGSSKVRRRETSQERKERKEKEKRGSDRSKETEEERRKRKEKEKLSRSRKETEEERQVRKEKERTNSAAGLKEETAEERKIRKNKERGETEEERKVRKEKERESRHNGARRKETEEERRIRKEKEKNGKGEKIKETEEERRIRKEKEKLNFSNVTPNNNKSYIKEEKVFENDNFSVKEPEAVVDYPSIKQESDEDINQGIIMTTIENSDDDIPLARRKKPSVKRKFESCEDSDDEAPLSKKVNKTKKRKPSNDEEDSKPSKKSKKKGTKKDGKEGEGSTKKMTKKEKELEEEKKVWKWWEEDSKLPEGVKWRFLEHKGPLFVPEYERLPPEVRFWYDGQIIRLSDETEECATFYGRMLDHDYTTKETFNKNFFKDWRKTMTNEEKEIIRDLSKCDFSEIDAHFKKLSEEKKNRTKEEKDQEKERQAKLVEEMGFCTMDGHKEKIGNFRTEPPALFRGRGEHPKMGMIKRRIQPEDVIINCSKDSQIPVPPPGHKWKEIRHDNTVTWLASWTENIQGSIKYIMLNPSSRLKGEKDWQKYEKARELKDHIEKIREGYTADMRSNEMRVRQRAVALYFIDKLALRAGNEKDGEEQADTVGCCSLRVEHIELHESKNGKEWVVEFDFLGKDSIRYQNEVEVDKKVFKNVRLFLENKVDGDDLFDRISTFSLNVHLNSLMDGLTAKVFRTFNASFTLQDQLDQLTNESDNVAAKMLAYNRANRAVAVLCNHQRAVPKTHEKSMENLEGKMEAKKEAIKAAEKDLKHAKKAYKKEKGNSEKVAVDKCKKVLERLLEQLEKLEIQRTDRDENKTIALGTSKLNYLDPRISVQWCKTHEVPIEKVINISSSVTWLIVLFSRFTTRPTGRSSVGPSTW